MLLLQHVLTDPACYTWFPTARCLRLLCCPLNACHQLDVAAAAAVVDATQASADVDTDAGVAAAVLLLHLLLLGLVCIQLGWSSFADHLLPHVLLLLRPLVRSVEV
jgi:hypothetical protein